MRESADSMAAVACLKSLTETIARDRFRIGVHIRRLPELLRLLLLRRTLLP